MKSTIWLSYDLGVRGDFENLYAWLDAHKAKECVGSVAVFVYEYSGALVESLKNDLASAIEVTRRTRMYVIYRDGKKIKGIYLFGGRRSPTWSGFSASDAQTEDES